MTVTVRITDNRIYCSSACSGATIIDRLKEIIFHDLAKDLCSGGKMVQLRGRGGGKHTPNVAAFKSALFVYVKREKENKSLYGVN